MTVYGEVRDILDACEPGDPIRTALVSPATETAVDAMNPPWPMWVWVGGLRAMHPHMVSSEPRTPLACTHMVMAVFCLARLAPISPAQESHGDGPPSKVKMQGLPRGPRALARRRKNGSARGTCRIRLAGMPCEPHAPDPSNTPSLACRPTSDGTKTPKAILYNAKASLRRRALPPRGFGF